MSLTFKDCSPFEGKLSERDIGWLSRLANASRRGDFIIRLQEGREDEPIVRCDIDGTWWAGRYVGSVIFEGRPLHIRPRFGERTLQSWFAGAFNLALTTTQGELAENNWFIPWLLASVWSQLFVSAARHGLPNVGRDVSETSLLIKGRLDIAGTVRLRGAGLPTAVSIRREKSLNNPITAVIVSAYNELSKWLGPHKDAGWLPTRIKELIPHLITAVGPRPRIPTKLEIDQVRLTPITAEFHRLAELSLQIANGHGLLGNTSEEGECQGVMLDVAELWELYVLAAFKNALPNMLVEHGTHLIETQALMANANGEPLATLKPDIIIKNNRMPIAVIDAKYKRLWPTAYTASPQREDIYQITAYLSKFGEISNQIQGVLAYPDDPAQPKRPDVEIKGPWFLDSSRSVQFLTLPHDLISAVEKIKTLSTTHSSFKQLT